MHPSTEPVTAVWAIGRTVAASRRHVYWITRDRPALEWTLIPLPRPYCAFAMSGYGVGQGDDGFLREVRFAEIA